MLNKYVVTLELLQTLANKSPSGSDRILSIYVSYPDLAPRDRASFIETVCKDIGQIPDCEAGYYQKQFAKIIASLKLTSAGYPSFALFLCDDEAIFIPLPHALVESKITLDSRAHIMPLLEYMTPYGWAVCVLNKTHARIFTGNQYELKEQNGVYDSVRPHSDGGGWSQKRLQRAGHEEFLVHLKHINDELLALQTKGIFSHLIVIAQNQYHKDITDNLHPYLREIFCDFGQQISSLENNDPKEILACVLPAMKVCQEKALQRALAGALAVGDGAKDLDWVLGVINEKRAQDVIFGKTEVGGGFCEACKMVTKAHEPCPLHPTKWREEPDLADLVLHHAILQGAHLHLDSSVKVPLLANPRY